MACVSYLTGFRTSCGSNLASIKTIWVGQFGSAVFSYEYQKDDQGQYVVDEDNHKIIEKVTGATLQANYPEWVEFQFRKNTSEMTTEMTRNDNGSFYFTNAANLVFAKQNQQKRLALQATASGDCSMIVLDSNGIYWLIGSDNPVTASTLSATTGVAVGDANQYSLTLRIVSPSICMPVPLDEDEAATILAGLLPVPTPAPSN